MITPEDSHTEGQVVTSHGEDPSTRRRLGAEGVEARPGVGGAARKEEEPTTDTPFHRAAYGKRAVRLVSVALVVSGLAYLGLLAGRLPDFIEALSWNSDAVSPAVLMESLGRVGGPTTLGDTSYATTLTFDWITRDAPAHRLVWALGPYALALAGAGLLGWSASRIAGRHAGIVSALIVVAASPAVLFTQIAPAFHGTTWFAIALLSAALVFLAERPQLGLAPRTLWIVAVGLIVGANLASDPLLGPAGLVPLALAPLAVRGTARARTLLVTCAVGAGAALLVAVGLLGGLHLVGVDPRRTPFAGDGLFAVTSPADLAARMHQLPETVLALVGPDPKWGLWVAVAAVLAVLVCRRSAPTARTGGDASSIRRCYGAFWLSSIVLAACAYSVSGAVSDEVSPDQGARYLVPLVYGVAALAGPWTASDDRRRVLGALAAILYVGVNLVGLAGPGLPTLAAHSGLSPVSGDVQRWLADANVSRGYAGYWDAQVMRYRMHLPVAAVVQCRLGTAHSLCPDRHNSRGGWYTPAKGPSFLLVNPTPRTTHVISVLPPAARFGRPVAGRRFGAISAWIYPYDLAGRLEPVRLGQPVRDGVQEVALSPRRRRVGSSPSSGISLQDRGAGASPRSAGREGARPRLEPTPVPTAPAPGRRDGRPAPDASSE